MVEKLKEGMVLDYNTSDSIDPITMREYGKHTEKLLVLKIKGDEIELYNLSTGKTLKEKKNMLDFLLRRNVYAITEEWA